MTLVAWIHTEGALLSNKYHVFELAYQDILGMQKTFFIKSPISYYTAKKQNPYLQKSCETIICTKSMYKNNKVYSFNSVLNFLKKQFYLFKMIFKNCLFGYKGASFQPDILRKANIPAINLEDLKFPSIATLAQRYPHIKRQYCPFHPSKYNKCATHILNLFSTYNIFQ